ncbi:MAG: c-type cytochrome [Pirellulales bacterium]|nr:c-type cytochrome [Pirellulales bacterium]
MVYFLHSRYWQLATTVLLPGIILWWPSQWSAAAEPLSPPAALAAFQLPPGFRIELVAAEPEVIDPVDARFGADGRLWVVEMRDYPSGPADGQPPKSRVRWLEDRDADGRYETAHDYADGLLMANGLQPWRSGVIVTLAGAVVYLPDDDRDGHADRTEVWYTGFAQENEQLRASNPRWAIDGRVYVANGLRGGAVLDARRPEQKPLAISGMDFCFDPISGACEAVTGMGQFGMAFDQFGNRFVCSNRNPLIHLVLENHYLARNPLLAIPTPAHDVVRPAEHSHVYPISRAWTTSNLHAGTFTAACGSRIFNSPALGPEYLGAAFTCEPTGNLVHCELIQPDGATFSARAAFDQREFLATKDEWFRPVNLANGPDGALYVVDMYRAVIEHPDWMPEELRTRPDLLDGVDRGRIYRVVRDNHPASSRSRMPSALSGAELVETLNSEIGWRRTTAARLLVERQDRSIQPALEAQVRGGPSAAGRVQALWLLQSLKLLTPELLAAALKDQSPRVREHAARLCEPALPTHPELVAGVLALADDPDARLAFQAALSLGAAPPDNAIRQALLRIGARSDGHPWLRYAVLSSLNAADAATITSQLLAQSGDNQHAEFLHDLGMLVGAGTEPQQIERVLSAAGAEQADANASQAAVDGLASGAARRGKRLQDLISSQAPATDAESRLVAIARAVADDAGGEPTLRLRAIRILAALGDEASRECLGKLAAGEPNQVVRAAAITAVAPDLTPEMAQRLAADLSSATPTIRAALLDATSRFPEVARRMVDLLASGELKPTELDAPTIQRLTNQADAADRDRAIAYFAAIDAERERRLAQYHAAVEMEGDAAQGKALFQKHCATCHRIGAIGVDVAPDISDSRVKTKEQLLVDVLEPNRAIDNNYISYTLTTTDGRSLVGVIAAETASSITLKQPEAKVETILRADIDELRSNGVSLMPQGWEQSLSVQDLANLLTFIKNWRYLDGAVPLAE